MSVGGIGSMSYTETFGIGSATKENAETTDFMQYIQEYRENLLEKIENGDTEQSYQIGNQSFTVKEWDEFLENYDSQEDAVC